jgi:CubicO group peptidase (beta-lactamase class C family)
MMLDMITAQLGSSLDQLAGTAQRDGRAPSLVLAAGQDGECLHHTGQGGNPVPSPQTQYRVGSISKTFTAALVMQLRDEGRLDLDEPIGRLLPELGEHAPTARRLLTHTSGLQAEPDGPWWERSPGPSVERLLAGVTAEKFTLPPGRFRHYSNLGYGLLGALLERLTGRPWREVLQARILDPAGLRDTGCTPRDPYARGYLVHPWAQQLREEPTPDTAAMAPAGQLWSTTGDLLRWAAVLVGGHDGVLSRETAEEMRAPAAIVDARRWSLGTGLGIQLNRVGDRVYCGHTGSMPGFVACLAADPDTGWATVAFANCYTGARVSTLAHTALEEILDAQPEPIVPWRPDGPVSSEVEPVTGRWWWMGNEITIGYDAATGQLLDIDGGDVARLDRLGPDRWRYLDGPERGEDLRVLRAPNGGVEALNIRTFIFTRDPWPVTPR